MASKRSIIWKVPKTEFEKLIKDSQSFSQVLRFFGLNNKGGNNNTVKKRCICENIDYSHIRLGINSNKGRKFKDVRSLSKEEVISQLLVSNCSKNRTRVKFYILKYGLIEYKCKCGNTGNWNGNTLSLQLDHINGISNDNRIENLRFLCPNCHSQTETFAGKSNKILKKKNERTNERLSRRKVIRPSKYELMELVWKKPTTQISKQFGVSDTAIKKWCISYKIKKPTRGYWAKANSKKTL